MLGQIFAAASSTGSATAIVSQPLFRSRIQVSKPAELTSCDASAKVATCRRGDPHSNVTGHLAPPCTGCGDVSCKMNSGNSGNVVTYQVLTQSLIAAEMTHCETLFLQLATLSQSCRNPFTIHCHCLDVVCIPTYIANLGTRSMQESHRLQLNTSHAIHHVLLLLLRRRIVQVSNRCRSYCERVASSFLYALLHVFQKY